MVAFFLDGVLDRDLNLAVRAFTANAAGGRGFCWHGSPARNSGGAAWSSSMLLPASGPTPGARGQSFVLIIITDKQVTQFFR